jgi:hypothetical protein
MRLRHLLYMTIVVTLVSPAFFQTGVLAEGGSGTQWAAVLLQGKKLGYMKVTRTVVQGLVTTRQEMKIEIKRGSPVPIKLSSLAETTETSDGKPLAFKYEQSGPGTSRGFEGTIGKDGKLHVRMETSGSGVQEKVLDWPREALMEEGARVLIKKAGLKEGTTLSFRQFMPDSLEAVKVDVRVGKTADVDLLGRVVPLTHLLQTLETPGGSLVVESFVDKECDAQKTIMPMMGMNMEIVSCTEAYAKSLNGPADFFDTALVASPKVLTPADLGGTVSYELEPKGGGAQLLVPSSDEQQVTNPQMKNGALVVRVSKVAAPAGVPFPYSGSAEVAIESLKPSTWVQSDAKEIIALARKAVGNTRDTVVAVKRIQEFVRAYIKKKDLSVGYASALEVVKGREGDCTEHAVLTAALCRAVGIPARVATGVAYAPEFIGKRDVFVPHEWAQAYIGGTWISIDAALNGFDAGHIALGYGNGDPFSFFGLINTMGNFKITGVEPEGQRD